MTRRLCILELKRKRSWPIQNWYTDDIRLESLTQTTEFLDMVRLIRSEVRSAYHPDKSQALVTETTNCSTQKVMIKEVEDDKLKET